MFLPLFDKFVGQFIDDTLDHRLADFPLTLRNKKRQTLFCGRVDELFDLVPGATSVGIEEDHDFVARIPTGDYIAAAERHREGLLDTTIDLGITQFLVELVYLVHVDKSDPAHIARHNVAKLQKGIARPHAKRGVPAQFVDLTAQLLNFALEAEYFAY